MIKDLIKCGEKFLKSFDEETFSRYESWEFCYNIFQEMSKIKELQESEEEFLAMNLGFYLASWGMYRGSTFLLQTNYKIHIPIVKIVKTFIEENKEQLKKDEFIQWEKIAELKKNIKNHYENIQIYKNGKKINVNVTDTLITKIIMGTIGIVPAYDTNVKSVLDKLEITQTFNKKSYEKLYEFYLKHEKDLKELQDKVIKKRKIYYPKMKILDMCFWQYYLDKIKKKN